MKVHIRWMIRRDMAEVLDIERRSFEFPWFDEDFIRCLRERNCIGMVASEPDVCRCVRPQGKCVCEPPPIFGFMIYELHKTRLFVLNFAVHPEWRKIGVGRQMVDKLTGKLATQRRNRITLQVRETNLGAQLFFQACGFQAVAVIPDAYADTEEGAYLMEYRLPQEASA